MPFYMCNVCGYRADHPASRPIKKCPREEHHAGILLHRKVRAENEVVMADAMSPKIPDRVEKAIEMKTLLYHVYPSSWMWRLNLDLLQPHFKLFDRVVVAVVQDRFTEPLDHVRRRLPYSAEVKAFDNVPNAGEGISFDWLRGQVTKGLMFYAHAKGVTRVHCHSLPQVTRWVSTMYARNLTRAPAQVATTSGIFRRHGSYSQFGLPDNRFLWHYSGTFYWMNVDAAREREGWWDNSAHSHASEAFPGNVFAAEEAACAYADHCGNLYEETCWAALDAEVYHGA